MSDIEQKLRELLAGGGTIKHCCGQRDADNIEADIERIKQAFKDAGWFTPADKELVQEIVNHRAQQKIERVGFNPDAESYSERFPPLTTGQEWYDRFAKEFEKVNEVGELGGSAYVKPSNVMAAAKKASGLN